MVRKLLLFLLLPFSLKAQFPDKYWIHFKDREPSEFTIEKPEEFLSQASLYRRANQGIPITKNDLPISKAYVKKLRREGFRIGHRSRWLNAVSVHLPDSSALLKAKRLEFVDRIKKVGARKVLEKPSPTRQAPPIFSFSPPEEYKMKYGSAFRQMDMHKGQYLHDLGYTGEGISIAVIDAGFSRLDEVAAFQHLFENKRILGTYDFVDQEKEVYDDHWHGTFVLSPFAGMSKDTLLGTAPDASYWLLRSEDASQESIAELDHWVAAAEYADSVGADIINTSLGYTQFDDTSAYDYSDMDGNTTVITKAADIAASKGILVVASAGNAGNTTWQHIGAPADGDSVLAVGGVRKDSVLASFSSIGPSSDGRIKPDVVAMGEGTIIASNFSGGTPFPGNGTSFSAPIIAGMAACLWQAHPKKNNMELFNAIKKHGHLADTPDNEMGWGVPNFHKTHLEMKGEAYEPIKKEKLLSVYPNPFSQRLNIQLFSPTAQFIDIKLFTLQGKLLVDQSTFLPSNVHSNLTIFEPVPVEGLFILKVNTRQNSFVKKIERIK